MIIPMIRALILHFQWCWLQSKKPVRAGTPKHDRLVIITKISNYKGCLVSEELCSGASRGRGRGRTSSPCHLFEASAGSARGGHACPQGSIKLRYSLPPPCSGYTCTLCLRKLIVEAGSSLLPIPWDFKTRSQMRRVARLFAFKSLKGLLKLLNIAKDSI